MTSSSSKLTSSTALPASRWATICLWIYSMAPTSRPRVGCTAISSSGSLSISRAMMAFCWLPPDMLRATVTGPWPERTSYCSIRRLAYSRMALRFRKPALLTN